MTLLLLPVVVNRDHRGALQRTLLSVLSVSLNQLVGPQTELLHSRIAHTQRESINTVRVRLPSCVGTSAAQHSERTDLHSLHVATVVCTVSQRDAYYTERKHPSMLPLQRIS